MNGFTAEPAGLTNAAIQKYAERIGEHHQIYSVDGHADVDGLLKMLGGRIEYAMDDESLHVFEPGNFTVYIPQFTSSRRDRFTLAHELGHYFLHYVYKRETAAKAFGRGGRDRAETEANVFASALLMPEEYFKRQFHLCNGDTWSLASIFGVSPKAADVRAEVLGTRAAFQ
ncbi:hypothetical protein CH249_12565 [Rhodococcus sp. 05-2255-3B1]|uniref:ImmA/IrrE family metallo-endopeptidase n=1 Tax=unclassified Rhodococcus (in: high G+C Gram-positive bacteria) TaxID=192944 RepID=UPI000B9BBE51|nr:MULTISPECIES: ImmA/IrrE family metallo-endopeptidase [unclassified Rhodococcus (in: high G+C Gram-positive bacteria)]OZE04016.1 hypothetical protein CH250_21195 [Rhodococcus sp. 05-2255-3C]OZE10610.1 hypothetical protein CH249_12565 [Rhodococcus sp. 05-2255-3B1]OZE20685.1 hypothetical protein CH255_08735 [Rhodococcus sp. 05-2255-2A2]